MSAVLVGLTGGITKSFHAILRGMYTAQDNIS
jgi:hypothetical protein